MGSDDKEVRDSLLYKIVGAEVSSTRGVVERGLISLGAPASKRLGLCMLAALAAGLPYTADSLHSSLVGSWVSVLLYRKVMMAHMNRIFQVIPSEDLDTGSSRLHPLPRAVAEEMLVLACLGPFAASNVAAPFSTTVYASDSSALKGGLVAAEIPEDVVCSLWRTAQQKVKNPKLQSRTAALHRIKDEFFEEFAEEDDPVEENVDVSRPIGLRFDFLEICGGAGVASKHLSSLECCVGPVFDISYSRKYDIASRRVFLWLAFMCEEGRLLSFLAAPPCTTFSPAAFPPLRSYSKPLGFCRTHPRVLHGNDMAFSSMGLMVVAKRTKTPGVLETPRRSKMRWTPQWKRLPVLGADEVHLASCAFGSVRQKEFALMTVCMNAKSLGRKCSRDHDHVRIQGCFTKASATYCDGLARAMARVFARHIHCKKETEIDQPRTHGLEDVLSNELLVGQVWKEVASWRWRGSSHINILETAAALRAYEKEALKGGDLRFVDFIDSNVALSALGRGRSSSLALRPLLKRASTLSVAYGLYHHGRYAPTRYNPADHPARDNSIPSPSTSVLHGLPPNQLRWLSSLAGLHRWSSNWLRLCLLLCPSWIDFFSHDTCLRRLGHLPGFDPPLLSDFDSTLGFPGEGPRSCWLVKWIFLLVGIWVASAVGVRNGDAVRREQRRGLDLPEGRRVTEVTSSIRVQLTSAFNKWLRECGMSFEEVFLANPPDLDRVNSVLTRYGRFLFSEGKPYYHFAETTNSVSARRPLLRRSLQQAWDLCAMWTSFEPCEHHQAMPVQVLLAVLATCLLWGWTREAGIFAMCWGMLLRIGEILQAKRSDIIFPQDVRFSIDHVLLRIMEPKTRFRAARHQSSKLEPPDLIAIAWIGLGRFKPYERIWPCSSSTLRSRLDRVLAKLGLPTKSSSAQRPLTLASFRPGGATFLISLTESADFVQRRGRRISLRVMNIYLQEVAASTFMNDIDPSARATILTAMEHFSAVRQMSVSFAEAKIPEKAWNILFRQMPQGVDSTGQVGRMGANRPTNGRTNYTQKKYAG